MSDATLALNAQIYHYDRDLDGVADLIEQGPHAVAHLSARVRDLGQIHKEMRDRYREAVDAGVVPPGRDKDTKPLW